jgi:signal transduction histidine kinase
MKSPKPSQSLSLKSQIENSPLYILWIIALFIFVCECVAMFIVTFLRPATLRFEVLLDSLLLVILLSPVLYFFLYRPLLLHIAERKKLVEVCESRREQEIHKRERTEQDLALAYAQLKETYAQLIQAEKMQELGRLASGVAHEVKNPLAIILQGIEYLKDKLSLEDPNVSSILRYMGDAIIRADNVVVGMLDFASLSNFEMKPAHLNFLLDKTLALMKIEFDRHQIRVQRNFKEDLPLVDLDAKRIEQIFVNLLLNAVQAMPGGGSLSITTETRELQGHNKAVLVRFEDEGRGIPKDIVERIFDPFFTTRREQGGYGLGLTVSRHIMEMHGGKIDIENKKDSPGVEVTLMFQAKNS